MKSNITHSLQDLVGEKTYSVWVEMLRVLVPDGRTHRLSVVVAGMLQYALEIAVRDNKGQYTEEHNYVAMSLIDATETWDPENVKRLLHEVVTQLFNDAGVSYERVSKRGERYSITDSIYEEYLSWYDYPWD
jgi:hypothetical protein